jgi:hypothetical protein
MGRGWTDIIVCYVESRGRGEKCQTEGWRQKTFARAIICHSHIPMSPYACKKKHVNAARTSSSPPSFSDAVHGSTLPTSWEEGAT